MTVTGAGADVGTDPLGEDSRYETLLVSRDDGVVHMTLNRPEKKNAINATMWVELASVFAAVAADSSVRVLVVRGAGGAFCAGADLGGGSSGGSSRGSAGASAGDSAGDSGGRPRESALTQMTRIHAVAEALVRLPVPTVACVDGVAVGAGCNLALACDVVLASTRSRFSQIFVRRGLSPDFGGSWLLPRLVGLQRAKLLCLTGDIIEAQEAADIGLVAAIHEPDRLEEEVGRLVERLRHGPPLALALTKRLLNDGTTATISEALAAEAAAQAVNLAANDAVEARRAFFEKRDPVFTGR